MLGADVPNGGFGSGAVFRPAPPKARFPPVAGMSASSRDVRLRGTDQLGQATEMGAKLPDRFQARDAWIRTLLVGSYEP